MSNTFNELVNEDEEREEYFSGVDRPVMSLARPTSRNRGKIVSAERMDPNDEVLVDDGDDSTGHISPTIQLPDPDWVIHEEKENTNTPITAYLNAFFMTIATVLVCRRGNLR